MSMSLSIVRSNGSLLNHLLIDDSHPPTTQCSRHADNYLWFMFISAIIVLLRHVRIAESEPYCHSILFVCLFVWMSVGHSTTYSLPRLINHNQIWSAGIYLSSDPCKPFWIPCLPYFGCQMEKYAKFCLFPTRILANVNVTHRAI